MLSVGNGMMWVRYVGNSGSITGGGKGRAPEHVVLMPQPLSTLPKNIYKGAQKCKKTQEINKEMQKLGN
jgi:hypothetical protein